MFNFIILAVLLIIVIYLYQNRIIIRVDTFFRKGFKRIKDEYGVYCWCR